MERVFLLVYFLLFISIISCSDTSINPVEEISVFVEQDQLWITNNINQISYLFVIEQNAAAVVDWIPGYKGLNIKPGNSILLSFNNIIKVKDSPLETGDKVLVYYWVKSLINKPKVNHIVLTL